MLQPFTYNFIRAEDAELQPFHFLQRSAGVANGTRHFAATVSNSELRRYPANDNLQQIKSVILLIVKSVDAT